ncbi:putative beta-lactamase-like 1 [Corticium candelabrum]|uniref:putative beta-lactamase-like 1 n=1 Tax=Corticium candelabrum TaxID=121492 RepID=UPI002E272E95|nr:putative beta-lactamase-like 1 [Corticium candelabrum]
MTSRYLLSRLFVITILLHLNQQSAINSEKFLDLTVREPAGSCPVRYVPEPLDPLPASMENALKEFENALNLQINKTSRPAVSASVVYRGREIWAGGLGVKSKEHGGHPLSSTVYRIGSVSKVFVVIMVYQMLEKGYIASLDDELHKYIPEFDINNPFGTKSITLRQMMSQLSGLPREAPCLYGSIKTCHGTTNEDIYARLKQQSLILPPWTRPSYSNLAFALLGNGLVNLLPNMTYEDYVLTMILEPLGMTMTGFNYTKSVIDEMAVGYDLNGSVAPLTDLGWLGPAGQMYSTVNDLAKLGSFLMSSYDYKSRSSSVLQKETIREMLLPLFLNPDGLTQFGTPWEMRLMHNYLVRRKGGNVPGYSALFSFIPELQLGVNILWSGAIDENNASVVVYDILIPALTNALSSVQPKPGYPSKPANYEGTYKADIGASVAEILSINDTLVLTVSGISVFMEYVNATMCVLFIPSDLLPCMESELFGITGDYVYFQLDKSSVAQNFTIPGYIWGATFIRTS